MSSDSPEGCSQLVLKAIHDVGEFRAKVTKALKYFQEKVEIGYDAEKKPEDELLVDGPKPSDAYKEFQSETANTFQELKDALVVVHQLVEQKDQTIQELKYDLQKRFRQLARSKDECRRTAADLADARQNIRDISCSGDVQVLGNARRATRELMLRVLSSRCDIGVVVGLKPWMERHRLQEHQDSLLQWAAENSLGCLDDIEVHIEAGGNSAIDGLVEALGAEGTEASRLRQQLGKERDARSQARLALVRRAKARHHAPRTYEAPLQAAKVRVGQLEQSLREGCGLGTDPELLNAAEAEVARIERRGRQAKQDLRFADVFWVLASRPLRGLDGVDISARLRDLVHECSCLTAPCDWPGLITARAVDKALFDKIADLESQWREENMSDTVLVDVTNALANTLWYQLYKASVKGALVTAVYNHPGIKVKAVCIQGGVLSRAEARLMPSLLREAVLELGVYKHLGVEIELVSFESLEGFEEALRTSTSACGRLDARAEAEQLQGTEAQEDIAMAGLRNCDNLGLRWKRTCDQFEQANKSLWLEMRQPDTRRTHSKTSQLLSLFMEMQQLCQRTLDLRTSWERSRLGQSAPKRLARSTGSLPKLSSTH